MCGRARFASRSDIIRHFDVTQVGDRSIITDTEMIATPGQRVPIVVRADDDVILSSAVWGFGDVYNARVETITEKPMWAESYHKRRCVLPITSFYEGGAWFSRGEIVACGGIWRLIASDLQTALITTEANELVAPHHHRMPLIVSSPQVWLKDEKPLSLSSTG